MQESSLWWFTYIVWSEGKQEVFCSPETETKWSHIHMSSGSISTWPLIFFFNSITKQSSIQGQMCPQAHTRRDTRRGRLQGDWGVKQVSRLMLVTRLYLGTESRNQSLNIGTEWEEEKKENKVNAANGKTDRMWQSEESHSTEKKKISVSVLKCTSFSFSVG